MIATSIRVVKQIIHDKRSILMIFVVPLIITSFLYFLLGEGNTDLTISTNSQNSNIERLIKKKASYIKQNDLAEAKSMLKSGEIQAYIDFTTHGIDVYFLEENSLYSKQVHEILTDIQEKARPDSSINSMLIYGDKLKTNFEKLAYALIPIVAFFLIFLISGIAFVREQVLGTLERILINPVSKIKLVLGYTLGFSIFGILQGTLLLFFTKYILKVPFVGHLYFLEVIIICLSVSAVSIGMFVAIFANTEFQMVQFIPIVIIPQILYSGILPIDKLPFSLEKLRYIMPIYYGAQSFKKLSIDNFPFSSMILDLIALVVCSMIFTLLNTYFLKKYRAI